MEKSPYFCIVPWVHVQIHQSGDIFPCCRTNREINYGNWKEKDLTEIWNGETIKNFRRDMLAGKRIKDCESCYALETTSSRSQRQSFNEEFKDLIDLVDENAGATIPFIDIRFSNICNFKCRYCNHENSSGWGKEYSQVVKDYKAEKPILKTQDTPEKLWAQLDKYLPQVKKFYFAGGEPLLDPDHYLLLEKLIAGGMTDIELCYNTNLSVLKFQNWDVIELWKKFSKVSLGISLDGIGEQLELLRKGAVWREIQNNYSRIKKEAPHVELMLAPTIGALNAFHFTDALREWLSLGMIPKSNSIQLNVVEIPEYFSMQVYDEQEVDKLKKRYSDFASELDKICPDSDINHSLKNMLSTILQMSSRPVDDRKKLRKEFAYFNISLDKYRSEKTVTLFPELFGLLYSK